MAQRRNQQNNPRRWQRRYLPRKARIALVIAAVVVVVGGLFAAAVAKEWIRLPSWQELFPGQSQETTPTEPKPDTVIQFVAGGDINITDGVIATGAQAGGYDYADVLLDVTPTLAGAHLTAMNLEGNLVGEPYGSDTGSAPQGLMESLRNAGVDILQTANSKSVQNGLRGLQATIQGIRNAGMESLGTFGTRQDFENSGGFLIREIQGIRVAMVAFTKGMEGSGLPTGSEHCVNLLYTDYSSTYQSVDTEGITAILNRVQAQEPDLVIAMLHWGSELNDQISKTQTKIVKLMGSLGVDAIIGTHSHYVQKMGFDKDSGVFVAYSLGDFLGDGENVGTNYSVLLQLEITKSGTTGQTTISGFDYVPIYRYADENGVRLLRIREAITGYESRYVNAVSEETYNAMKTALTRIESRVNAK